TLRHQAEQFVDRGRALQAGGLRTGHAGHDLADADLQSYRHARIRLARSLPGPTQRPVGPVRIGRHLLLAPRGPVAVPRFADQVHGHVHAADAGPDHDRARGTAHYRAGALTVAGPTVALVRR